jgi:hypothetical protein
MAVRSLESEDLTASHGDVEILLDMSQVGRPGSDSVPG